MNKESVLITGSTGAFGEYLASTFAKNDYNLILHGRNKNKLKALEDTLTTYRVDISYIVGDLKDDGVIEKLFKSAEDKDLSVLVNNAAIICPGLSFETLTDEQIDEMIAINLIAPIKLSRKIYPLFLIRGSGCIINMNSIAGLEAKKPRSIYCSTKFGLRGFTKSLQMETEIWDKIRVLGVYSSKMNITQEDSFGMNPKNVAEEIYNTFKTGNASNLIIDGRPEEYRIKNYEGALVIDGRAFEIK